MKESYTINKTEDGFYDLLENEFKLDGVLLRQTLVKRYKSKSGAKKALERYEWEKRWKEGKELVETFNLSEFKLLPNAKPGLFHNSTVRSNVKYIWQKKVRPAVLELKGKSCSICGWKPENEQDIKNLQLHEVEEYDFDNMVCHLKDIVVVCGKCHSFHHIARTKSVTNKEQWYDLLRHFVTVNGCTTDIVKYWPQFESRVFRLENEKTKKQYGELPPFRDLRNKTVCYSINAHIPFVNEMMRKLDEQGLLYQPES